MPQSAPYSQSPSLPQSVAHSERGGTAKYAYPIDMYPTDSSNLISITAPTEPVSAARSIYELEHGEESMPSAFNPGLSPIGTGRGADRFALNK